MANQKMNHLQKYHQNRQIINEFLAEEKNIETEKENKYLLRKLISIAKKGFELPNKYRKKQENFQNEYNIRSAKTLNLYERKKKVETINLENTKFAKRITKIRPVISYKSHQEDYERMEKIIKMQQKQKIFKTKNMTLVRIDTPKDLTQKNEESLFPLSKKNLVGNEEQQNDQEENLINNKSSKVENEDKQDLKNEGKDANQKQENNSNNNEIEAKSEKTGENQINSNNIPNAELTKAKPTIIIPTESESEPVNTEIYLNIQLERLIFTQKKFDPTSRPNEKYFLEIKAFKKELRRTLPETYLDFSKSVINEFVNLRDLENSRLIYVGIYKIYNNYEMFIGDFDLDIFPYLEENVTYNVTADLQNIKNPPKNYLPKELGYRGIVVFKLKIKSNVKKSKRLKDAADINTPNSSPIKQKTKQNDRVSTSALRESMSLSKK